ncbi:DUF4369 domain-containing protein [Parabacteroides distasonis]|uniref:DUF4369 domain-containing protein n=4 Tax=Parabacteroides distasonis TaxID=823 RepID=UPI00232C3BEF|nr:DUF4369 domain-containing protein [Parabacteroides distasonis]MDB9131776.1 DUF4369 domain-containing protein [Parabacteroides distasonis]
MKSRLIKKGSDIYISEPKRNVITKYKVFIVFFMLYIPTKMMSQFGLKGFMDSTFDKDSVYLYIYKHDTKYKTLQTVIKNSQFQFYGKSNPNDISILHIKRNNNDDLYNEVILDNGNINVYLALGNIKIEGSKLNNEYKSYIDSCSYYFGSIKEILDDSDPNKLHLNKRYIMLNDSLYTYLSNYIIRNINNCIGKSVIKREIMAFPENQFNAFKDSVFKLSIKLDPFIVELLKKKEDDIKLEKKMNRLYDQQLLDMHLINLNNDTVNFLNVIKNQQYTYVEFWASYCSSCLTRMSNIEQNISKESLSKIQIITISIDDDILLWKKEVGKLKRNWENFIISSNENKKIREEYFIRFIPYNILVKSGKIIGINISPKQLDHIIKQE